MTFSQFVFDNTDFHVCTLDGLNTFHSMGGIQCITPSSSVERGTRIPRWTNIPTSKFCGELGVLPEEIYQKIAGGVKHIIMENLGPDVGEMASPKPYDILFMCAKWLDISGVPKWKSYMHSITKGMYSVKKIIVPLPFINFPPSDYGTIYTALQFATNMSSKVGQKCFFVTFDQPLYSLYQ